MGSFLLLELLDLAPPFVDSFLSISKKVYLK